MLSEITKMTIRGRRHDKHETTLDSPTLACAFREEFLRKVFISKNKKLCATCDGETLKNRWTAVIMNTKLLLSEV